MATPSQSFYHLYQDYNRPKMLDQISGIRHRNQNTCSMCHHHGPGKNSKGFLICLFHSNTEKKIPFFSVFNSKEVIEIFELASIPFEASLLPQNYNYCQSLYVGFLGAVASYGSSSDIEMFCRIEPWPSSWKGLHLAGGLSNLDFW